MSSSNDADDLEDTKSTFIDKILGEMKSEFNKIRADNESSENESKYPTTIHHDNNDDDDDDDIDSETRLQSELKASTLKSSSNKPVIMSDDSETASALIKDENTLKIVDNNHVDIANETKPRIVLTLRTEKSKSTVTSSSYNMDKDKLLRIKTNSIKEEKKPDPESGLKRSARRRSKDCTESILQSAIARKEKSYNETLRPQRLTRRLKPTAKILANLEMCQRNAALKNVKLRQMENKHRNTSINRQQFSYNNLENGTDQVLLESEIRNETHVLKMSEQLHEKLKRKHKHKSSSMKKTKHKLENLDSDSISSFSSHQEVDGDEKTGKELKKRKSSSDASDVVKSYRKSYRKSGRSGDIDDPNHISEPLSGNVADEEAFPPAQPEDSMADHIESAAIRKCLCQTTSQIYITTSGTSDVVYCTALDSINDRVIGCNNIVSGELAMLRPSANVPYIILCEVHKQRLLRHNCCPTCGLFCTQGRFTQCARSHQYHRDCQVVIGDATFCPHCGLASPKYDTNIVMKCMRKPVFLPTQKYHYPSAKMSFHSKSDKQSNGVENQQCPPLSPPLIPIDEFQLTKEINVSDYQERFDIESLHEAIKINDCEKVAAILRSKDVNLSEFIPTSDGTTVLHYASQEGLLAIVHMLLVAGAEQDVFDKEQNTPLMLAIQMFKNTVVKYLIKSGASVTLKGTDGMSALHLAAKSGNQEACEFLLSSSRNRNSYINSIDDGGWTPLVWACEHGHKNATRYLLQNGADPLLRDVEQNVALHWASFSGSSQIIEMLLNSGCEVNAVNAHGDSPLHVAARQDKYNCVLMLLARGANVHLVNKTNETPLDCCVTQPGDCRTAISLNVQLQSVTLNGAQRQQTILTNDISRGKEINPVQCINTLDDEPEPSDFVYITENCTTSDINVDRKITNLQSCECQDRCLNDDCFCANNSLRCWYDEEGKLIADFNYSDPPMIFECNPMCKCNAITCNNRVVQHGLTQRFQLFHTLNKGWGIRSLRMIPRGTYVCEYVGEIISDLEADQREDDSYLFDLDNRDGETFCIDARRYGNFSRFINHSCEPNLLPVRIYIDHQDLRFPRIAFFANRDIEANEELGFDYGDKFWIIKYKSFTCTCGYPLCRYSDTSIRTTLENYWKRLAGEQESVQDN